MGLKHAEALECTVSGAEYDPEQVIYTCSEETGINDILEVTYDHDRIIGL